MGSLGRRYALGARHPESNAQNPDRPVRVRRSPKANARGPGAIAVALALAALGPLGPLGACAEDQCPDAASRWRTRRLTVEQMKAAVAPYDRALARALMEDGITCSTVPIGVDARNDLPVYIQHHCDDLCPDYAQFVVIYDETFQGDAACGEIGACRLVPGALGNGGPCTPFAQGYASCYSEEHCNWNASCEPDNDETPFTCPKECTCGDGLTGTFTDRLVAGIAIPVHPEDDPSVSYNDHELGLVNSASAFMAALAEILGEGPDLSTEAATAIREGRYVLVARAQADAPSSDDYVGLWLGQAPGQAGLALDGHDEVTLDVPLASSTPLCGQIGSGGLFASGTTTRIALPLPGLWDAFVTPTVMSVSIPTWDASAHEALLTVTIPLTEVEAVIVPAIAEYLNDRIAAEPTGPVAQRIAASLDGVCGTAQCPEIVPGQGECAASTPPVITPTEVRCHRAFYDALKPNAYAGWDGTRDSLVFGFRATPLVPVRLTEP